MAASRDADRITNARSYDPGRRTLFVMGLLLISLSTVGVVLSMAVGSKTTSSPSPTTSAAAASAPAATSKTTTTTKNVPSDELIMAALGAGAVLVAVGGLYGRITSLTLPSGVEVELSQEEKEKVARRVIRKAQAHTTDAEQLAKVTAEAIERGQALKAAGLPEKHWVDAAAEKAVASVVEPPAATGPPDRRSDGAAAAKSA